MEDYNNMKKIILYKNNNATEHSTTWRKPWTDYAEEHGIEYEMIDLFACNAIEKLREADCLLWHFGQYRYADMLEARSILYSAKLMGLKIFPDYSEAWHFDDKIAEMYALQAVGAPMPKSWVFYNLDTLKDVLSRKELSFPIVAKLRTGSGSHNVKLLRSEKELMKYGKTMLLQGGFDPSPNVVFKTMSNIRSSHNLKTLISKAKRAPEFFGTLHGAREFPNEKGYVYLQEFIPNEGYDLKVVVVGDKCSGLVRPIRRNDFRASGGGEVFFEKKYFTEQVIKSAFAVADALGTQCIGFDYVVDSRNGQGMIVEMSYGFAHEAVMASGGWFDRDFQWHEEEFNAPKEILSNLFCRNEKN